MSKNIQTNRENLTENDYVLLVRSLLKSIETNSDQLKHSEGRHPLGIYNLSISRILDKITKTIQALDELTNQDIKIKQSDAEDNLINHLELTLYAAAEHIDDLGLILDRINAKTDAARKQNNKALKSMLFDYRREISSITNTIKHSNARIRIFSCKAIYNSQSVNLIGFFIETHLNGKVGPNFLLQGNKGVISLTSFIWNIIKHISLAAKSLSTYLIENNLATKVSVPDDANETIHDAINKLALLPIFSFDDDHPLSDYNWNIGYDPELDFHKYLYSVGNLPHHDAIPLFQDFKISYRGDGMTKEFTVAGPSKVSFPNLRRLE